MTSPHPLKQVQAIARLFFRAIVGAYALNTILHIIGILLIGEQWVVVELFNTFAHLLWLPTFILIPICLILREWRLSLMMLPALIAFVFVWGDMLLPNPTVTPSSEELPIRVVSYNLSAFNNQPDDYLAILQSIDADIIALQELATAQANPIRDNLANQYPYMAFHDGNTTAGQGVMSKYPIVEDDYWQYDFLPNKLGHQRVVIELEPGRQIVVYNVHPTNPTMQGSFFDTSYRAQEIADLLDRTSNETLPVLLMGDFNMPDFSQDYRATHTYYADAFREGGYGLGWTFPRLAALNSVVLRLDYIFIDEEFRVQSATVWGQDTGSDHSLLYADLLFSQ